MTYDFYYDDDYDQVLTIVRPRDIGHQIVEKMWMDLLRRGNLGWYEFDNISTDTTPFQMLNPLKQEIPGLFVDYANKKIFFDGESCSILKLKYGIKINVRRPI